MYDRKVLQCFLDNQLKLFPEEVAGDEDEAEEFLTDCFAVVCKGKREVLEYFEEVGSDYDADDILEAAEVFDIGDGRYLIVEA